MHLFCLGRKGVVANAHNLSDAIWNYVVVIECEGYLPGVVCASGGYDTPKPWHLRNPLVGGQVLGGDVAVVALLLPFLPSFLPDHVLLPWIYMSFYFFRLLTKTCAVLPWREKKTDVPVGGVPIKIGDGFVSLEQGDFHSFAECEPCIRAKLFYIDENDDERIAAEVLAPFRDPDTKEERGWAVVVREAYMELVEAVEGRLY